jgi:hypothetical protein
MLGTHLSVKHGDRKDFEKLESFPTLGFFANACDKTRKKSPLGTATGRSLHLAKMETFYMLQE